MSMTASRWSIARQIALLIVAALLLLTAANFAVTFGGPPPRPAPVRLSDAVTTTRDGVTRGEQLSIVADAPAFVPRDGEMRQPDVESRAAAQLNLPPDKVRFSSREPSRHPPAGSMRESELLGEFSLGMETAAGRWRILRSVPQPMLTAWHRTTIAITLALTLLLAAIATRITVGIVRPIQRLAAEAEQAYVEGQRSVITIAGPPEVAHLGLTIAAMRDRFAALIESRTMMLAAIAHDMATPLSRLEFHVAKMPKAVRVEAEEDLAELSAMIASILGYARGSEGLEAEPVDMVALTQALIQRQQRSDARVTLIGAPAQAWVRGDEVSLRRLLSNLVGNAQRYAGGGRIEIAGTSSSVTVRLLDDGPGFDPSLAERLFDPFFRLEQSRNRETAGTGLGLATARTIASAHGGTIVAINRPEGGAEFRLTLPAIDPADEN